MTSQTNTKDFEELASWVESMLSSVQKVSHKKAFHDHILGTHVFERHEVALLDTPLLQRLRYISQTGLVYLTFPGARHSRFEHTLGAAILVDRYVRALNSRSSEIIDQITLQSLRIAAILHDCGHAFFSHTSESAFKDLPIIKAIKDDPDFSHKGAGELVSYAIITSPPFRTFFSSLCEEYDLNLNLDMIAGFIIGRSPSPDTAFIAEIISGPFDVDKLDYVHRDAHSTGLKLVVDLERFFYAITIVNIDSQRRLAIESPEPLEQLIFSKMLLFATVYHHHKVKGCDCLVKGAINWSKRNKHTQQYRNLPDFRFFAS